jgi:cation diffusion facilitator family transporter
LPTTSWRNRITDLESLDALPAATGKSVAESEKQAAAGNSVWAAVFLTIIKLVVGLMSGSLGMLAEAAHSALDLVAAVVTFLAVNFSDRPADQDHTYGHGKIENFSALIETLLLVVTCVWIVYESVQRLFFHSTPVDANIWAFAVMGISIVVNMSRSKMLYATARKHHSQALEADALHFSTDVWSSWVVVGGLAGRTWTRRTRRSSPKRMPSPRWGSPSSSPS